MPVIFLILQTYITTTYLTTYIIVGGPSGFAITYFNVGDWSDTCDMVAKGTSTGIKSSTTQTQSTH